MFGLGYGELLIVLAIIVLIFGGKKLPMLGGAIGESIKNFKKGIKEPEKEVKNQITEKNSESNGSEDKKN